MKYSLEGVNGNAYAVMGYVRQAMRKEGISKSEIDKYLEDAQSSDYSHLLCVSFDMIDKLNENFN